MAIPYDLLKTSEFDDGEIDIKKCSNFKRTYSPDN